MGNDRTKGIVAGLMAALLMGLAPVFGRQAILQGLSPFAVVALRTSLAAALLFFIVLIFNRQFLYIYPVGLLGCLLAGALNGFGSLLYYMSLERLHASIGQMLYSLYPFFLAIWMALDRYPISRMTYLRIILATISVLILVFGAASGADLPGVLLMLGGSMLYALHLPINQRVLYDVPAQTVALYTLIAMSMVVVPAYFLFGVRVQPATIAWGPIIGLTLATFFSRILLFLGVKQVGGLQTSLLGLSELLMTIIFSHIWLKESLTALQWVGAAGLTVSLLLARHDTISNVRRSSKGGWLNWIRPGGFPPNLS